MTEIDEDTQRFYDDMSKVAISFINPFDQYIERHQAEDLAKNMQVDDAATVVTYTVIDELFSDRRLVNTMNIRERLSQAVKNIHRGKHLLAMETKPNP